MRTIIDTRFADSRAADLSLAYGLAPLPALGSHRVVLNGIELELRVLGTSHQVLIGPWSETVACLPDRDGTLPTREEIVENGLLVRFASQTLRLDEVELADRVAGIIRACGTDEHGLVGEFPGSPLAVTALRAWAEKDGTAWRTWHAYPQAGELVETRSLVVRA
ncbi:MAG: DUF2617 family protein [Actinophytocola sp.]|uniref:DUF2617 family protein n=1 Tax=Actinophytocola sp. TaxID=1872138 RepID=UPI003D6ABA4C